MSTVIKVENLSKRYRLGVVNRDMLYKDLQSRWAKLRGKEDPNAPIGLKHDKRLEHGDEFWALRNVDLEVKEGEILGIIGRNGAGKSTLLKILSQITAPTEGKIKVKGRIASLLEVGTGFHPELTGRENVYLNGAILGMTRREVTSKFDEIVAFADIDEFIDTPVKRYSSGMYVRLAFAVAAHLEPEILIVDEVLAVGDLGFQRKCTDHMKQLVKRGATVLLVSHNMFSIKSLCKRALLLADGRTQLLASVETAIDEYERDVRLEADPWAVTVSGEDASQWPIIITGVHIQDENRKSTIMFRYGDRIRFRILFELRKPIEFPNFCVGIRRADNISVCSYSSARDGVIIPKLRQSGEIELITPPLTLVSELYGTHIVVWDRDFKQLYSGQIGPVFHVRDEVLNSNFGVFHQRAEWEWNVSKPKVQDNGERQSC